MASVSSDQSYASSTDDDSDYDTFTEENEDEEGKIVPRRSYLDDLLHQDTRSRSSREIIGASSDSIDSSTNDGFSLMMPPRSLGKNQFHNIRTSNSQELHSEIDDEDNQSIPDSTSSHTHTHTHTHTRKSTMYSSVLMNQNHNIGKEHQMQDRVEKEEKQYIEHDTRAIENYLNHHHSVERASVASVGSEISMVNSGNNNRDLNTQRCDLDYCNEDDDRNACHGNNDIGNDKDGSRSTSVDENNPSMNTSSFHFDLNSAIIEDHQLYYFTNSANPIAIKQTFLYSIQKDDVPLLKKLLRDIGIEYLLRHCLRYHGSMDENVHFPSTSSTSSTSSAPISKSRSTKQNDSKNQTSIPSTMKNDGLKKSTKNCSANIFWLAALHGSAKVLEILLQVAWVHFAEMSFLDDRQMNNNEELITNVESKDDKDSQLSSHNQESIYQSYKNEITKYLNESASSYGTSPMYIAAAQNHKDVIAVLLNYGVDPNKPTGQEHGKSTPAIIAASRNHIEALQGLAESDVIDFNKANEDKITPLLAACQNGCINAVRFLTTLTISDDNGFDIPVVNPQCQSSSGYGCASIAAQSNQHEVIIYLCQIHDPQNTGIDVNQRSPEGDTVIHVATKYNRKVVVKALLEMIPRTCNITQVNKYGMNALHIAADHGYTDIVKEFIHYLSVEQMHEFDAEDLYGMTPIFYATLKGHYEIVAALASISNINTLLQVSLSKRTRVSNNGNSRKNKNYTHQTPLHVAAESGFVNIVYTLLNCGAEINKVDSGGHTALSLAAKEGKFEVVKTLVEHGADVKIKSHRGKTPLTKAKKNKHQEIVEYLEQFYVK